MLQVWADWFLFSDAYVNGLRATFLRTGNSGVTPFHSLCGDAPDVEQRTSSDDAGDGGKVNPDGALAIGKGAAMKELLSLPLTELERRCRHNGLSIVGGREMMVARLLYLEEAEKQRGHELDEDLKFASHSSSARFPSTRKDSNLELDRMAPSERNSQMDYDVQLKQRESVSSHQINSAPHYNSIDFSSDGKSETILPTSKWAREDDESDDEQKRSSRDLGLTYSSSGSENAGDGLSKIKDAELTTDTGNSAYPESGMNEELRYGKLSIPCGIISKDRFYLLFFHPFNNHANFYLKLLKDNFFKVRNYSSLICQKTRNNFIPPHPLKASKWISCFFIMILLYFLWKDTRVHFYEMKDSAC